MPPRAASGTVARGSIVARPERVIGAPPGARADPDRRPRPGACRGRGGSARGHGRDAGDATGCCWSSCARSCPGSRAEAEAYLANVEQLALTADPVRLGVIVSRVRAAAPVYLDWRDQQFASQAEAQSAYLKSGAAAFDATWSTLQEDILLTVANRIDTVLDVVDEMQGGR